jgi:hypothetical protein
MGPWGQFQTQTSYGPYATGIPNKVRVIYVPAASAVRVLKLEPGIHYRAEAFDAVTGRTADLGPVIAEQRATWMAGKPPEFDDDWVLVLNASKDQQ